MEPSEPHDPRRSLRRTFAWRSALVVVVVAVAAQLVISNVVNDHVDQSLEFHAEFVARTVVAPLLPAGPVTDDQVGQLSAALAAETRLDGQVTAVEVVDPREVVVLSDDLERIGGAATRSAGEGEHRTRVPVDDRPDVVAVDVLQDRSATDATADRMRRRLAALSLAGLLLLWLVLLPVADRLGRRLQRRTEEVEEQRAELSRLLERERETTRRLTEINQLKDGFLSAVSHELRTPLTIVRGMLDTLGRHGEELAAPRRAELLERAGVSAAKLDELLTGLLALNDPGDAAPGPAASLDLADVVAEVRSHLPPHDLELALEAPVVTAEPFGLERILSNLLGNAVRHAPGGPVRLESELVPGGVELRVLDRGPGVPDGLKQAVFEPFRQGELRDPHSPGTGIGLALVARFVGRHGGCTWVSDRPGGGAVFHVRLPDAPEPQQLLVAQAGVCTHDHSRGRALRP